MHGTGYSVQLPWCALHAKARAGTGLQFSVVVHVFTGNQITAGCDDIDAPGVADIDFPTEVQQNRPTVQLPAAVIG